jgi:hypothetical protein
MYGSKVKAVRRLLAKKPSAVFYRDVSQRDWMYEYPSSLLPFAFK